MRRLSILIGVLLIAGALVWKSRTERATPTVPPPVWSDTSGVVVRSVTLWFGSSTGDSLVGEVRELPELTGVHERAAAAVTALEQGSRAGGARVIPAGTSVIHAYLDDSGLLTLDLSRPFRQGFGGGARTEELAIASLVRTVSAFVPEAKRIRIVCGGAAFPSLGGHFPLDRPLDPEDWL
jgi:hypothetical protein